MDHQHDGIPVGPQRGVDRESRLICCHADRIRTRVTLEALEKRYNVCSGGVSRDLLAADRDD